MLSTAHHDQKGAILPLLILGLLIIGLVVVTQATSIRQIFQSHAGNPQEITFTGSGVSADANGNLSTTSRNVNLQLTSPYGVGGDAFDLSKLPRPLLEDDFINNTKNDWTKGRNQQGSDGVIAEGVARITQTNGPYFATFGIKNSGANEWTAIFDGKLETSNLSKNSRIGIYFGNDKEKCDAEEANCYRAYLSKNGAAAFVFQNPGQTNFPPLYEAITMPQFELGKTYKYRYDRSLLRIKGWLSADNGQHWQQFLDQPLDTTKARGPSFGFAVANVDEAQYVSKGIFDNLKIWRLGQVSEPGSGQGATYYRYATSAQEINDDPSASRIQWQTSAAAPTIQPITLPEGVGTKTTCAQFKNSTGQTSAVYCGAIELKAQGSTVTGERSNSVPFNLSADCLADSGGRRVRLSWSSPQGFGSYKLRVNNTSKGDWKGCGGDKDPYDLCQESLTSTTFEMGVEPGDTYDFWVHASNGASDTDASEHKQFTCSTGSTPPSGTPTIYKETIYVNPSNQLIVGGNNFGAQTGTLYYSRGGSHEVKMTVLSWSNTQIKASKAVNDALSPVANSIAEGQYIRVCQSDQSRCSSYVTLPALNARSGN